MENFIIKQIDSMTFVGVIIVLTPTELKKLECKDLEKSINNIVKELNIDWAVETDGQHPIVVVSRMYGSEVTVDSAELHDLTTAGTNFLCAVDKLELQKPLPVRDHNNTEQKIDDYKFIKELVDEWDETEERVATAGFVIMAEVIPGKMYLPCGQIKNELVKELCICYLKVHGHDK